MAGGCGEAEHKSNEGRNQKRELHLFALDGKGKQVNVHQPSFFLPGNKALNRCRIC